MFVDVISMIRTTFSISVGCTICVGIVLAIPVSMIVMGELKRVPCAPVVLLAFLSSCTLLLSCSMSEVETSSTA